jgi:hypothetical protein
MKRLILLTLVVAALLLVVASPALAQTYLFSLDRETVDAYWEADGTLRVDYAFTFTNDVSADPLDAVDIGVPTSEYDLSNVSGAVNGTPVTDITTSPYVTPGIALNLGSLAIPPGATGTVTASIRGIGGVLYQGSDANTVSVNFAPTSFDSKFVQGQTDMTVTFHLPPGVQPNEPRYYGAPSGWPSEPSTGYDAENRIIYQWHNPSANGYTQYVFGASFPKTYVPAQAVIQPSIFQQLGISQDTFYSALCCLIFVLGFGGFIALAVISARRRKLAYLPPKMAIEGHGIKRGLTAVEAAVLLETPLDKVLTMMLFSVIKKNAARVVTEEPLKVEAITPPPQDMRDYETAFMAGIVDADPAGRGRKLQAVVIDMVKSVQQKMKGFSLRETRDYYKSIMERAWSEVETADTPEVKSQKYSDSLEWTMLDRGWDQRTARTFQTGPVFVPIWWGNYRPSAMAGHVSAAPAPSRTSVPTAGAPSLPHLPGSDFAASLVRGVQSTAGNMVASVGAFTGAVTKVTNPPPPPSTYRGGGGWSGGGGHSCACACACAGCACACAGGGR